MQILCFNFVYFLLPSFISTFISIQHYILVFTCISVRLFNFHCVLDDDLCGRFCLLVKIPFAVDHLQSIYTVYVMCSWLGF